MLRLLQCLAFQRHRPHIGTRIVACKSKATIPRNNVYGSRQEIPPSGFKGLESVEAEVSCYSHADVVTLGIPPGAPP